MKAIYQLASALLAIVEALDAKTPDITLCNLSNALRDFLDSHNILY